jgi:hypothetical protein
VCDSLFSASLSRLSVNVPVCQGPHKQAQTTSLCACARTRCAYLYGHLTYKKARAHTHVVRICREGARQVVQSVWLCFAETYAFVSIVQGQCICLRESARTSETIIDLD